MDFKNFFAWLTGMKKLIFDKNNFFRSGHFLICGFLIIDHKVAGSKKVVIIKNQFCHARQPRKEIFEIHAHWSLIFMIICPSFNLAAPTGYYV